MRRRLTLPERVQRAVYSWPHWSRAERRCLDGIVQEVIAELSDGTGNPFVKRLCKQYLVNAVAHAARAESSPMRLSKVKG